MALKRVEQESDNGCFVACVATLAGISYPEAFKLIHPGEFNTPYNGEIALNKAHCRLKKLGWKVRKVNAKKIENLKKNALILITWRNEPELSHAVVYDAERKKVLDPSFYRPLLNRSYERQLHSIIYIEKIPREKKS